MSLYRILIVNPDGQEVELLSTEEQRFYEGAQAGAQALLSLMYDEMGLDEGFEVKSVREEAASSSTSGQPAGHRPMYPQY